MTSSYKQRTVWGVGIFVLLVCIWAFIYVIGHKGEDTGPELAMHTNSFNILDGLLTDYRGAQADEELYLLSGDRYYLDQLNASISSGIRGLLALRDVDGQNSHYGDKFRTLEQAVRAAFDEMKSASLVRRGEGAEGAHNVIIANRKRGKAGDVGSEIALAESAEQDWLRERTNTFSSELNLYRGAPLLIIGLLAATFFYVVRATQPAMQQAEEKLRLLKSELESAKTQLDRLANVDFLTEVLNLRGLDHALQLEENRTGRVGGQLVAVLVNCDNFRKINEGYGHAVGDAVLKELCKRIAATLRPSDHVARVGGDEFLVVLPDTQLAYSMRVAERIRKAVSDTPLRSAVDLLNVTVSIGVATLPPRPFTVEEVVNLARAALKRSKIAGKNRVSLARDRDSLEEEPPAARDIVEVLCDGAHFRTVFQPIIDLSNESIIGYEIFSRGPDGAFESPADFFRVCVENNILTTVDVLCLKQCIATTGSAGNNLRFHMNVFPSTILDTPIENLLSLFPSERTGRTYCVEISEQQFVGDPGYLRDHVNALREAGILVAIDDVGFGRSSLESLILLEPDLVKVDRKYVTGVSREPAKARLLRRVVNVAKSLGAEIVAEGIEVKDDLPILKEMGVHYGQGYYWGGLLEVLPTTTNARALFQPEKR